MYDRNPNTFSKDNFRRLNNFDGLHYTSSVGSYDPKGCDTQFELVRIPTSAFNPWYPIKEEVRTSYYDQLDPWEAERKNEMNLRSPPVMTGGQVVPPRYVIPQGQISRNAPPQQNFYLPPTQSGVLNRGNASWNNNTVNRSGLVASGGGGCINGQCSGKQNDKLTPFRETNDPRFTSKFNSCVSCGEGDCNNCSTCDNKNCDCDKYTYLYSPACGVTKEFRDYTQRVKPNWGVTIAPI